MKEAISDAENKRFSEFSKKAKTSLEDKLRSNPTIQSKGEELKKLQSMKNTFAKVSEPSKTEPEVTTEVTPEPAEPTEPAEPQED